MTLSTRIVRLLRTVLKCGAWLGAGYLLAFASAVAGSKGTGMRPVVVDATVPGKVGWRDRVADRLLSWIEPAAAAERGVVDA